MFKRRNFFFNEKAQRPCMLYCFRRRWLQAFWNIYIFINLYIILAKDICWPTKCFQDCFLKRTISEHSPCSPEIVLFFQKMVVLGQTTLSQWSCSPDVHGTFFFKFKFPKEKKKFVFKIWFYLRHLHPGVHFINCPHIFLSRELNWL